MSTKLNVRIENKIERKLITFGEEIHCAIDSAAVVIWIDVF